MPAKKLVYQAMVAMPALFMLGLGVKAHTDQDPFEFVQPTPKQNTAILAYANVVRDTASIPLDPYKVPQLQPTRKLAQEWVAGERSGKLQPLQPVSFDDSMRDGIKSEIMNRNSATASAMLYAASVEVDNHQYLQGARDALLGVQVSDVIKYSDYSTVLQGALYQRRGFRIIASALPHLSAQDRLSLKSDLAQVAPNSGRFHAVEEIEELVFNDYVRRQNPKSTPLESIAPYDGGGFRALAGHFHGELLASSRNDSTPVSQEIQRMAQEGEAEAQRGYQQLITLANATPKASPKPTTGI